MQVQPTAAHTLLIADDEREHWGYLLREQLGADAQAITEDADDAGNADRLERLRLFARLGAEVERGQDRHTIQEGQVEGFRGWLRASLFMEAESVHPEHDGPLVMIASQERSALCERLSAQLGGLIPDRI